MPPCAFAELHACSVVFVASATRAPVCAADVAAASPEAPLPTTSTSKEASLRTCGMLPQMLISVITSRYRRAPDRHERETANPLHSPAHGNPGRDRQADLHHRRSRGHARRGGGAHERPERRCRRREGL